MRQVDDGLAGEERGEARAEQSRGGELVGFLYKNWTSTGTTPPA